MPRMVALVWNAYRLNKNVSELMFGSVPVKLS
jgi:hypothetical protein